MASQPAKPCARRLFSAVSISKSSGSLSHPSVTYRPSSATTIHRRSTSSLSVLLLLKLDIHWLHYPLPRQFVGHTAPRLYSSTTSQGMAMTDFLSPSNRSATMAKIKGRNTAPELAVRRALFRAGFRFRLHRADLPGRPDIVLPRHRVVIFVHGCFWHGHDCPRGRRPTSNVAFWNRKLDENIERDRRNRTALDVAGWNVTVIWECALETEMLRLLKSLNAIRQSVPQADLSSEPTRKPAKKLASRGGTALPIMRAMGSSSSSG